MADQRPRKSHEYDDDIFTLKEDEAVKRRAHALQYALISTFAVLVLGVALYMAFSLTNERLAYQSKIVAEQGEGQAAEPGATDAPGHDPSQWPGALFPELPKVEASAYETRIDAGRGGKVEVNVPMSAAAKFGAYADRLADDGAQVYIKTQRLTVVAYKGIELHLLYGGGKNAVVICKEPPAAFDEAGYEAFPRPKVGALADASDGTGEGSRVLTYRLASPVDALDYCAELMAQGWAMGGSLEPQDGIFASTFRKEGAEGQPGLQISVDYFSGGDNYRVRFDFLQVPTPAP